MIRTGSRQKSQDFENRLIDFALRMKTLLNALPDDIFTKNLKNQITRSVTSPAFNYGEVQGAETKRDFIHKMGICLKELRETYVGIKFIERGNYEVNKAQLSELETENHELISIFVTSINTARRNSINPKRKA